jgi:hypothetical protein
MGAGPALLGSVSCCCSGRSGTNGCRDLCRECHVAGAQRGARRMRIGNRRSDPPTHDCSCRAPLPSILEVGGALTQRQVIPFSSVQTVLLVFTSSGADRSAGLRGGVMSWAGPLYSKEAWSWCWCDGTAHQGRSRQAVCVHSPAQLQSCARSVLSLSSLSLSLALSIVAINLLSGHLVPRTHTVTSISPLQLV